MNHPSDVFDRLFIESFPYYLGVAENAIQYVVDTEMDDTPQLTDAATICQERFTPLLWHQTKRLKLPFDWVYDRPSRDIAEWMPYDDRKRKTGSKQSFNLLRIMNGIIRYPHLAGAYYLQGSCSQRTILKRSNDITKLETKNKKHI